LSFLDGVLILFYSFIHSYVYQQQLTKLGDTENEKEINRFHLECNGPIQSRIILQPSSLDSEIHTRMTLKISEKVKREKK
jgi:hypothetical protein